MSGRCFARWVPPHLVGSRGDVVVAISGQLVPTDGDGQATLALNLVTDHGRRRYRYCGCRLWKDELSAPAQPRPRILVFVQPVRGDSRPEHAG